jgi:hypothetical protein
MLRMYTTMGYIPHSTDVCRYPSKHFSSSVPASHLCAENAQRWGTLGWVVSAYVKILSTSTPVALLDSRGRLSPHGPFLPHMNRSPRAWAVFGLDAGRVWGRGPREVDIFGLALPTKNGASSSLRQIFALYIQNIKLEGVIWTFFGNYFLKWNQRDAGN